MQKIASTLGVTLGEFFTAAGEGATGTIVRARDRTRFESNWSSAELQLLGASRRLEAVLITLDPGGRSGKHPASGHDHEEFAFVIKGPVVLTLGPDRHVMRTGDSVVFLAGELRLWENPGRAAARLMVVTLRR